jgi:hypothetical protein
MTTSLRHRGFTLAGNSAPINTTRIPALKPSLGDLLGAGQSALQAAGRILLILIAVIGLSTIYDEAIGDGQLPHLNRIAALQPAVTTLARQNSTQQLSADKTPLEAWQALQPSRELLTGISPEISAWLYELHQQHRILYQEPEESLSIYAMPNGTETIAAYRHITGRLYLGHAFWRLSDGQKVAVLAHEYRHYRQNPAKRISRQLAQLAGMGRFDYQSPIEEEAFAYERQALDALGL